MRQDGPGVILVVDDDEMFLRLVRELLQRDGHTVVQVADADSALEAITERSPDVIILDIEMPGMSGLELLSRIKPGVAAPVIVVSGREAESERVVAFELGADDYVVKPFLPREFAARVRAAIRRTRPVTDVVYAYEGFELRLRAREVVVEGEVVALSPREFDVLAYLVARAGQVISREQLLKDVWQSSERYQDPATVTEHLRRIRQKIEPDPGRRRWIRSVRNVGYSFEPG